jgi:hypothetical protein
MGRLTIDVAITSWPNHPKRIEYTELVFQSLQEKLTASQHDLRFYCSAETTRDPRSTWHGNELAALCEQYEVEVQWRGSPANLGANMNSAMRMGSGEFVFLNQDDWWLREPLDLSPGAEFLDRNRGWDMVRYCWPQADYMALTLIPGPGQWRTVDPRGRWPYGDDPHLRRRDFMDKWDWFVEGGGHGSASGALMNKMAQGRAKIVVADKVYYEHKGYVSAVLGDVRSGKNRRYEPT